MTPDSTGQVVSRLWRVLTHPRAIAARVALERDLADFRRTGSFLARTRQWEDPGKRLLIVSGTDWVAQVKVEVMLATALRLYGWTPIVLSRRGGRWAPQYFGAAGIDRLVDLDRHLEACETLEEWGVLAGRWLDGRQSFPSLLERCHEGVFVGRHALSTLVRSLRCGRLDLSDPDLACAARGHLAQSLRAAAAAERVLDEVRPDLVLFLEKGYSPYAEFFDAAVNRNLNVIQWVHSHRTDALALKRYTEANRHEHPFSVSAETWARARQMPWTSRQEQQVEQEIAGRYQAGTWFSRKFLEVNRHLKEPDAVRAQLGLDPAKRTAVIFSHVLWDATFFFGENLFDDYEEWLVETVKVACANPEVNWVVKLHPDYVWKLKAMGGGTVQDRLALDTQVGRFPPHVKLLEPETDLSTFSLFAVADYCVTVRGTIGIEMACFGIPVFTAGTGRYAGFGFTIDSATREEYLEKLRRVQTFPRLSPEQTQLARRHAYTLLTSRPLPFRTFEVVQAPLHRLGHPLDYNVVIRARSLEDLQGAEDLRAFAEWATDSNALDYLSAPILLPLQEAVAPAGY